MSANSMSRRHLLRRVGGLGTAGGLAARRGRRHVQAPLLERLENRLNLGFLTPLNFDAGGGYPAVVVADFNGDGHPDLVTNQVSVLLGNGDGTFQAAHNVGTYSSDVAVGDFNGDGHPDLATSDVSVLLGNGDGTFQVARNTGAGSSYVAVGDFNGDGHPDLATANTRFDRHGNPNGGTVAVLLGNGDGTFQAARNFSADRTSCDALAVGDFNGDGRPDLVTCSYDEGTVSVLLGNGDGTFQAAHNFPTGAYSSDVAVGDFNGGGGLDLVTSNWTDGTVSVLLGNGDGTFQAARKLPTGWYPASVAVADFNRDGHPDLVTGGYNWNGGAGTVSVLLGNGDGTFQAARNFPTERGSQSVAVSDVNGDGWLDAVVANNWFDTHSVSVLLNDGLWPQTDGRASTTTALASSANPSVYGQAVTFTATVAPVSPGTGTPTGTVTFSYCISLFAPDGTATYTAALSAGKATFTTTFLEVAGYRITASYNGDDHFWDSPSAPLIQLNTQASTTTALASSANPSVYGQAVTFTATVAPVPPAAGTPTGTVTFKEGKTILGTGTLNASAIATFSTAALSVGRHTITAVYGGTGNYLASTSVVLTQTVLKAGKATMLAPSSAGPFVSNPLVSFTAEVAMAPGGDTPTGPVTFKDGTTTQGTTTLNARRATFPTAALVDLAVEALPPLDRLDSALDVNNLAFGLLTPSRRRR